MNRTELITFLRNPNKLTSSNLNELEDIIEDSPYFLTARLLLAKGSKKLKDNKTKSRVAKAAIYSTDRILLKKYLSSNLFFLGQAVTEESLQTSKTKKERLQEEALKSRSNPAKKVKTKPPRDDKRSSLLKKSKEKPSELAIPSVPSGHLDEILAELKRDMQRLKKSRNHFVEVQDRIKGENAGLEEDTRLEDDADVLEFEKIAKSTKEPLKKEDLEDKINEEIVDLTDVALTNDPSTKEELESFSMIESAKKKEEKPSEDVRTELDSKEEEIFSKKLEELFKKRGKKEKTERQKEREDNSERAKQSLDASRSSHTTTQSDLKDLSVDLNDMDFFKDDEENEVDEKVENSKTETISTNTSATTVPSVEKKPETETAPRKKSIISKKEKKKTDRDDKADRNAKKDIIDRFIKDSPSIKYSRNKVNSTSDLSEDSAAWDANLASETLAKIYLDQGNKKRAKEIYKVLVLKYPEKKSYFENLISKIR